MSIEKYKLLEKKISGRTTDKRNLEVEDLMVAAVSILIEKDNPDFPIYMIKRANEGKMSDADAAMVKVYCSEMLNRAADNTHQLYGGMGLMEELPIQRLWRDSRLERIWDGTSEIQRHIITRSILRPLGA